MYVSWNPEASISMLTNNCSFQLSTASAASQSSPSWHQSLSSARRKFSVLICNALSKLCNAPRPEVKIPGAQGCMVHLDLEYFLHHRSSQLGVVLPPPPTGHWQCRETFWLPWLVQCTRQPNKDNVFVSPRLRNSSLLYQNVEGSLYDEETFKPLKDRSMLVAFNVWSPFSIDRNFWSLINEDSV